MISRATFQLLPFSDSVIFLSLVNLVLLVIEVHKLDSFNSPLPFSLNYSVSCSSVLFLPSLPNLFYIIFLLLQCKSLSTITSSLSAKVIFTTFLIVLFPWDQIPTFHPWLFQFSTITHTWLLFCVYLLILCLVSSIIKLPSTYVRFLQYFPCLCFPFCYHILAVLLACTMSCQISSYCVFAVFVWWILQQRTLCSYSWGTCAVHGQGVSYFTALRSLCCCLEFLALCQA